MPRRAKRTGTQPQPNGPVEGQRYGESAKQAELLRQMPIPSRIQPTPTPAEISRRRALQAAGTSAGPEAAANGMWLKAHMGDDTVRGAAQAPATPEQLMQIAAQMRTQTGLLSKTSRPNEPVTAGLPIGPGPGPEVMAFRRGSPVANTIAELARLTGDSYLSELAQRSQF